MNQVRTRTRACDKPKPSCKGKACSGAAKETQTRDQTYNCCEETKTVIGHFFGAKPVCLQCRALCKKGITEVGPCQAGRADANGKRAANADRVCKDTTNPIIKPSGSDTYECNDGYTDPGYSALDTASPFDLTKNVLIQIKPPLFTNKIMKTGTYTVAYSVKDASGNAGAASRTLTVVDRIPPVVTMTGDLAIDHEGGTEYKDDGATATDGCDGTLAAVVGAGHVANVQKNHRTLGNYTISYTATDKAGLSTTIVRTVEVVDTTHPVIKRRGAAAVVIEASPSGKYHDAGADAHDLVDGNITHLIKVDDTVNCSVPKSYTVRYNVIDAVGIRAREVTRVVKVQDTTLPVIHPLGKADMTVEGSGRYIEPGFSVKDSLDGDLTKVVQIFYIHRRIVQPKMTEQTPNATATNATNATSNSDDNAVFGPQRYGTITPMTSDGNTTHEEIYVPSIDTMAPHNSGFYVEYKATDQAGNTGEWRRKVTIKDTTIPTIYLKEPIHNMTVEAVTVYTEPGYHSNDTLDTGITKSVRISGPYLGTSTITFALLPAQKVGSSIKIRYDCKDHAGNAAVQKVRTVAIVDTTPPTTMLVGEANVAHEGATQYTDPGMYSEDTYDAIISAAAVITGTVTSRTGAVAKTNRVDVARAAGTVFNFKYTSTDSSGNTGVVRSRTVTIVDTTKPVLVLKGKGAMQWQAGLAFAEPGFVATDTLDGDITQKVDFLATNTKTGVDSLAVDTDQPVGTVFAISYSVFDRAGNNATTSRTVQLVDTAPPVIKVIGGRAVTHEAGKIYVDPGVIASDVAVGLITDRLTVDVTNSYDDTRCKTAGYSALTKLGACVKSTYPLGTVITIVYAVKDDGGRVTSASRAVTLVDTRPPKVVIRGALKYTINVGDVFSPPSCKCEEPAGNSFACTHTFSPASIMVVGVVGIDFTCRDTSNHTACKKVTVNVVASAYWSSSGNGVVVPSPAPPAPTAPREGGTDGKNSGGTGAPPHPPPPPPTDTATLTIQVNRTKLTPTTTPVPRATTTAATEAAAKSAVATQVEIEIDISDAKGKNFEWGPNGHALGNTTADLVAALKKAGNTFFPDSCVPANTYTGGGGTIMVLVSGPLQGDLSSILSTVTKAPVIARNPILISHFEGGLVFPGVAAHNATIEFPSLDYSIADVRSLDIALERSLGGGVVETYPVGSIQYVTIHGTVSCVHWVAVVQH